MGKNKEKLKEMSGMDDNIKLIAMDKAEYIEYIKVFFYLKHYDFKKIYINHDFDWSF